MLALRGSRGLTPAYGFDKTMVRLTYGDMLSLFRRSRDRDPVDHLHDAIVERSRDPALYGDHALPDTVEGRFESLALHVLVVLRRLRELPPPAGDVAQDLVDRVFAHLEVALRELGVGDFGVPKRMKKIAGAFYDRTRLYDPPVAGRDADGLAREIAGHLGIGPERIAVLARHVFASEDALRGLDLAAFLDPSAFAAAVPAGNVPPAVALETGAP